MIAKKAIKKFDCWDISLIKLSTAAFILFLVAVWPAALSLALSIHWGWYLAVCIIAAIRPLKKAYL